MQLSIQNLGKTYQDGTVALDDFNWELGHGVYGLLGPNGAGKSTLLEVLSLNLMPTVGVVLRDGRDVQRRANGYRRVLGYLPQDYGFYPKLRIRQFLGYMGRLHGLHGRRLRRRIGEVLEVVGLVRERGRKIKTLSGGMRQRLAIAQALLHEPELLVIDEPTTGLDPAERVAFRNTLFDLGPTCGILLSTHIVKDVEFCCHQMTLLFGGRQRFTGQPVEFVRRVEGRVFEVELPRERFEAFAQDHLVIATRERENSVRVRVVTPVGADGIGEVPGARPVRPNLEDAYVDFMRECRTEDGADVDLREIVLEQAE